MADLSEFTSVFRARVNLNDKRKANKRNRQALSCLACRTRKLKCDRQQPCAACTKRGEGPSCTFNAAASVTATASTNSGVSKPSSNILDPKKTEAQARLQKLEELVQQLIQSGAAFPSVNVHPNHATASSKSSEGSQGDDSNPPQLTPGSSDPATTPPVIMCYNENNGSYAGATHWSALLDRIQGLKEALGMSADSDCGEIASRMAVEAEEEPPSIDEQDFILADSGGFSSIEEAFAALPSRTVCDRLMSIYHSSKFTNTLFIHTNKFRREYEEFWKAPSSKSFVWLAVLYGILCLGSMMATRCGRYIGPQGPEMDPEQLSKNARKCLIAGKHTKGQPYLVEALLGYMYCRHQCEDPDSSLWALSGYITRLAQRLGYHRDPKNLGKQFTPFEAEMRRRTWFWVSTFDVVFSFQYGMPSIIHDDQCDTEPPSNISDEDFDEDTTVLPPPRPLTEHSSMLFYYFKIRMTMVFRKVIRVALAVKQPEYEEILKLDKELDETLSQLPPTFRFGSSVRDSSFADPSYLILHRIVLELSYHKCRCVLHRTYLTFERDNPNGTIVTNTQALTALQKSYKIWSENKHMSREAMHATKVLGTMLTRIAERERSRSVDPRRTATPTPAPSTAATSKSASIPASNYHMISSFNIITSGAASTVGGLTHIASAVAGTNGSTYNLLNFSATPNKSPNIGASSSNRPGSAVTPAARTINIPENVAAVCGYSTRKESSSSAASVASAAAGTNPSPPATASSASSTAIIPDSLSTGAASTFGEQPGDFIPRELTAREQMFGLGLGNDPFPMVDSFDPIDFDTLMGGSDCDGVGGFVGTNGAAIDWGSLDRYLFDQNSSMDLDFTLTPEDFMQITPEESVDGTSAGAAPIPEATSPTESTTRNGVRSTGGAPTFAYV
ncbi:hypothetical protein ABW19_dt0207317 [Dactylella cylindrospora]|nr:hypothetical protein ABW19_dt0207317 [Dactylella cylindrospora]